jgi:hypothetical protein
MIDERPSGAWNRFFFTLEPVYAAVYFRVFLSLWTIAFFVPRLPYLEELYTARAIHTPHPLLALVGVPLLPLWAVWCVVLSLFACLAAFAMGVRPRAMHVVILAHLAYLFGFDISILRGYGELAFYQWLLLWCMPYERLYDERGEVIRAPRWGTRLAMMQFCLVYLFTIGAKTIGGDGWLDGRTLYYTLRGHDYGSFLLSAWLPISLGAARILGWATLASETFIGLGLWNRLTRPFAMLVCFGMHLGMALSLRVAVLFHLLMVGHLALFLPAEAWARRWPERRSEAASERPPGPAPELAPEPASESAPGQLPEPAR